MNHSKISLADVLTILASLGFSYMCFLGTNFYTLGNVTISITVALIISLLLFSTVFTAKLLKRTSVNFKTRFIAEMVLLFVFTVLFVLFTYGPFAHYFTVTANKSEIVSKIQTRIIQAENMFPAYESYVENRKNLYNSKLNTVVSAKGINPSEYKKYDFVEGTPDATQLNKKMLNISANLFPTNYSDLETKKGIKEVATNWLLDAKKTTVSWKPIGITNVVLDIETNSNFWLSTLVEISKIREKGEQTEEFSYTLTFDDIKQYFTTVEKPSVTTLLLAFLMWVLMILSWFVAGRDKNKSGGIIKLLFGRSQTTINEL